MARSSGDLVDVLAAGTYETDVDAGWSTGDFDGSGKFDSGDLIHALADGGYEQGPRPEAVPEPSSTAQPLFGFRAAAHATTIDAASHCGVLLARP